MFKKGDVVEWSVDIYDRPVTEDRKFSVMVTEEPTALGEFSGVVVERAVNAFHNIKYSTNEWDVKQFKLKQQTVVSVNTPDNAFPVLKDGMVIETRCRGFYLVCADKFLQPNGYNRISEYLPDGKSNDFPEYDIVKIWSGASLWSLDFDYYTKNRSDEIIWQEHKNAKAIAEIEQQISTLQEKLATLREEK